MGFWNSMLGIFRDRREVLDITKFEDSIALKIDWFPLVQGGSSFCTHRLVTSLGDSVQEFKMTLSAKLFYSIFIGIGIWGLYNLMITGLSVESLIPIVMGILGGYFFRNEIRKESKFNRSTGQFTIGTTTRNVRDIHAVQLIREYVSGNRNSYYSYEINLIMRDTSRINVTDHGDLKVLRQDADTLSSFLRVAIWDAIDYKIPD